MPYLPSLRSCLPAVRRLFVMLVASCSWRAMESAQDGLHLPSHAGALSSPSLGRPPESVAGDFEDRPEGEQLPLGQEEREGRRARLATLGAASMSLALSSERLSGLLAFMAWLSRSRAAAAPFYDFSCDTLQGGQVTSQGSYPNVTATAVGGGQLQKLLFKGRQACFFPGSVALEFQAASFPATNLTITFYLRVSDTDFQQDRMRLFQVGDNPADDLTAWLTHFDLCVGSSDESYVHCIPPDDIITNSWVFLALMHDATHTKICHQVLGQALVCDPFGGGRPTPQGLNTSFLLGAHRLAGALDEFFIGSLTGFALSGAVLTPTELQGISSFSPTQGPSRWPTTGAPTYGPSRAPLAPTGHPTRRPSFHPSRGPSASPTLAPLVVNGSSLLDIPSNGLGVSQVSEPFFIGVVTAIIICVCGCLVGILWFFRRKDKQRTLQRVGSHLSQEQEQPEENKGIELVPRLSRENSAPAESVYTQTASQGMGSGPDVTG